MIGSTVHSSCAYPWEGDLRAGDILTSNACFLYTLYMCSRFPARAECKLLHMYRRIKGPQNPRVSLSVRISLTLAFSFLFKISTCKVRPCHACDASVLVERACKDKARVDGSGFTSSRSRARGAVVPQRYSGFRACGLQDGVLHGTSGLTGQTQAISTDEGSR